MPHLNFTRHLSRHVPTPDALVPGATVRQALDAYFREHPQVRGYVLDEQGTVRKHVAVFLNGTLVRDRTGLTDPVGDADTIFVAQALSGG